MSLEQNSYQKHLEGVSRSFAFCIAQLKEPFKGYVGLSYLLCRILDTVEDTRQSDLSAKLNQMAQFETFITRLPEPQEVNSWAKQLPSTMTDSERHLLDDSYKMLMDLHRLLPLHKTIIQQTVLKMSQGMSSFLKRPKLESLVDVDRYCFFVAGIVGEMLTRLLQTLNSQFVVDDQIILESHQFGLFLQKINLLKDQMTDQKEGRYLIHSREEVWNSLKENAQSAIKYITRLPLEEREYRLFCGWSLFLGLASLPWIKKSWSSQLIEKIPRVMTEKMLKAVTETIDDNQGVLKLFSETIGV